ncbi:MAG: protein kinase [Planctomycetes bacterium]|nr:protein kinase [Planctomycetota bacterium]
MSEKLLGKTLGGCEIIEIIGHGGMGVIFKARQKSLDRIVAMKVLAAKLAMDMNFVARFQREARAIARVNHPNILAVYDVGSEEDTHYMIMELIEGESLAELQQRQGGGPLKVEDGIKFIKAAAMGLEAAHATGITHRDIKPENLMVTNKGVVKVSDFGLAKETDATGATSTDAVMGTPAFMSPEQCDGKKVDGRSDIYSLGGTFYKLITGRLPFEAETAMSMMYRHKHEALIPPKEIVPSIPQPISAIVCKMMAKKPSQRQQSMTEVVESIEKAARGEQSVTPAAPAESAESVADGPRIVLPRSPTSAIPPPGLRGGGGSARAMPSAAPADAPPPGQSGRLGVRPRRGTERVSREDGGPASSSAQLPGPSLMGGGGDDAFSLVSRGDELIARGDRLGGLKLYRQALQTGGLDAASVNRLEQELKQEISVRRQAGESLLKRGSMVEASREYRVLIDLDPKDELSKTTLKDIETKLAAKRTVINDVRTAIAAAQFEKAIELWDRTPPDLRDEQIGKQIDHLRSVVVPSLKLCEQAERYNEQGRLDEAVATFEDALRIDEHCDRARQGLGEAEGKRQRIEIMLKEGYDYSMQQDFEKAIEIWLPILHIQPGHGRAVKSVLDAFQHIARDKRGKGDFRGALMALKEAKEVDPQNRGLLRELDQMTELHDKELALIDRASDAAARGRTGEAIRYWEEVRKVNPANKQCREAVDGLKKRRGKSTAKLTAILAATLIVLLAAFQYFKEYSARGQVLQAIDEGRFNDAREHLAGTLWIFLGDTQKLGHEADITEAYLKAMELEKAGNRLEAALGFRRVADLLRQDGKEVGPLLVRAVTNEANHFYDLGESNITAQDWPNAKQNFKEAFDRSRLPEGQSNSGLVELSGKAQKSTVFIEHVEQALKFIADSRRADAIQELKLALKLREDNAFVREQLDKLGVKKDVYEDKLKESLAHLKTAWRADAPEAAETALSAANQANPGQAYVQNLLTYAKAWKECSGHGMVLWNSAEPDDPASMGRAWRSDAFCVDRYEYPNRAGELPLTGVTWMEAREHCAKKSKVLCNRPNWEKACYGKAFGIFPWGAEAGDQTCHWNGDAPKPSGSFEKCHSNIGTYDMSGNVAEWVDDTVTDDERYVTGGSFKSDAAGSRCQSRSTLPKDRKQADIGFRCCKQLTAKP